MPIGLAGGILKRTMADIVSRGVHADPKISTPDILGTSHSVNGAQINDAAGSHPKSSMTTAPSLQPDGNTPLNVVNENSEKIETSIAAAAADLEIAHQVWMNSSERDDEVRVGMKCMMDWVHKLVSVITVTDMLRRFDLVALKLHAVYISRNSIGLLPNIIYLRILMYCSTLGSLGVLITHHFDSQGRTRDHFDGHTIKPSACAFEHGNARRSAQTRCIR
jgi:hypothetical protein